MRNNRNNRHQSANFGITSRRRAPTGEVQPRHNHRRPSRRTIRDAETLLRYSLDDPCQRRWASGRHADSADPPLRLFLLHHKKEGHGPRERHSPVDGAGPGNWVVPLTTRATVISVHVSFIPIVRRPRLVHSNREAGGDEEFFYEDQPAGQNLRRNPHPS